MKGIRVISLLLLCGLLVSCTAGTKDFFIKMEDIEIPPEEYRLLAYDNIALVSSKYHTEHGLDANAPDFWQTPVDGKTPFEEIKKRTDPLVQEYKGLQLLAKEKGILSDVSYEQFLRDFAYENEDRKKKLEADKPIYGLQEFNDLQYYSYRQSQIEFALEDYIASEEVVPTEEVLYDYYKQLREVESDINFIAQLHIISWHPQVHTPELPELLEEAIRSSSSVAQALEGLTQQSDVSFALEEEELVTRDMGKDTRAEMLRELVYPVEAGQFSELYQDGEVNLMIYVSEKEWEDFGSFEESLPYVENLYREQAAQEYIQEKVDEYSLDFGKQYEEMTFEELFPKE